MKSTELFNVGDWVIITDEYIKNLSDGGDYRSGDFIKRYNYPQQIVDKKTKDLPNGSILNLYYLSSDKVVSIKKGEFRIASESDFRKMQIKKIFIVKEIKK